MFELGKHHKMAKLNVVDDNDLTKSPPQKDRASVLSTTCNRVITCDCAGEGFAVLLGGGQQHLGG